MSQKKSKREVKEAVLKGITTPKTFFYNEPCANWQGEEMNDDPRPHTEYVAELLLKKYWEQLQNIKQIPRDLDYRVSNHDGVIAEITNRGEEMLAKALFIRFQNEDFFGFGKIKDYQIPLKKEQSGESSGVGKVDMFSYCEKEKKVYFIELKAKNAPDTLLRCVLEAFTYTKQVVREKFCLNFDIDVVEIVPLVLIFKGSLAHAMRIDIEKKYTSVNTLADRLGVKFAFIDPSTMSFTFSINDIDVTHEL